MTANLERFVLAQAPVHHRAMEELRRGHKTGHWMWFVFPQLVGLGRSEMSRSFAIADLDEARAYLAHPVLGRRLLEAARLVLATDARTAIDVFGDIDAIKLRSSMTLFARAAPGEPVFGDVLDRFFGGRPDPATDERLGHGGVTKP
ncbi:MAG TPA: DUF1810 domain-containing protein [Candidatus Limnocylindrales bacterium]|nr:DUF1810 domain-containing protein [Candidatus Limnocylindrales bacterium]